MQICKKVQKMCNFCTKSDKMCKKMNKMYYFFTKCAIIWVSERTKEEKYNNFVVNTLFDIISR